MDSNVIENKNFVKETFRELMEDLHKVIMGQEKVLEEVLIAFFTGGHVLLEGVPGTAKTLMMKILARVVGTDFERIQFTPDMMPSDVVGTHIFDMKTSEFYLKKGPIFTNILLADEINRTPPKTQSALLEAMEENQCTIEGERIPLPNPFMVAATQNPIEFEGTYPLPEAQMDRFLFKIIVNYPENKHEIQVLKNYNEGFNPKNLDENLFRKTDHRRFLERCRQEILKVNVREDFFEYIMKIVESTRNNPNISLGASPRGAIALLNASKTRAAVQGRDYLIPDDIKETAYPALRHRIILKPEAEIEGTSTDDVIKNILTRVEVPR